MTYNGTEVNVVTFRGIPINLGGDYSIKTGRYTLDNFKNTSKIVLSGSNGAPAGKLRIKAYGSYTGFSVTADVLPGEKVYVEMVDSGYRGGDLKNSKLSQGWSGREIHVVVGRTEYYTYFGSSTQYSGYGPRTEYDGYAGTSFKSASGDSGSSILHAVPSDYKSGLAPYVVFEFTKS